MYGIQLQSVTAATRRPCRLHSIHLFDNNIDAKIKLNTPNAQYCGCNISQNHSMRISYLSFSDDSGAVYPGSAAKLSAPAGVVGMRSPSVPRGGNLRLEEKMLVLLHSPSCRHHDCQPGADHLDPQSHEFHSGKRRVVCVSLKWQNVIWFSAQEGLYVRKALRGGLKGLLSGKRKVVLFVKSSKTRGKNMP